MLLGLKALWVYVSVVLPQAFLAFLCSIELKGLAICGARHAFQRIFFHCPPALCQGLPIHREAGCFVIHDQTARSLAAAAVSHTDRAGVYGCAVLHGHTDSDMHHQGSSKRPRPAVGHCCHQTASCTRPACMSTGCSALAAALGKGPDMMLHGRMAVHGQATQQQKTRRNTNLKTFLPDGRLFARALFVTLHETIVFLKDFVSEMPSGISHSHFEEEFEVCTGSEYTRPCHWFLSACRVSFEGKFFPFWYRLRGILAARTGQQTLCCMLSSQMWLHGLGCISSRAALSRSAQAPLSALLSALEKELSTSVSHVP